VLAVVLGVDPDVVLAAQSRRLADAGAQRAADAALELLAQRLGTDAVDEELDARLPAGLPVLLRVAEDPARRPRRLRGSSGVMKTSSQRAKRGREESPPPTRRLKPRVPSSATAPRARRR
jgi:hypothetical protein